MAILAKDCHVIFNTCHFYHTLVVHYHAQCSIACIGLSADMDGILIT